MLEKRLDPVTTSVVERGLFSVADEMAAVIVRTAYSPLVRDLLDFTVALCNPRGEMVVQGVGMAIHLGALPTAVAAMLKRFEGNLRPGDALIMNDPYEGGMHLPNIVLVTPIFCADELMGHAVAMAHMTDVGGHVPGSVPVNSREVFAEGLRIPPLLLERDGKRDETLMALIEKNSRLPRDFFGDLEAQITACRLGERRFSALARRYGNEVMRAAMAGLLDRSEKMARAEIAAMPDGVYPFEDWLDNDGMDGGPQRLFVTITIAGDNLTADFTGTDLQAPTAINSPLAYSRSAFYLAVRSIMNQEIPNTAGFFPPASARGTGGNARSSQLPGGRGRDGRGGLPGGGLCFRRSGAGGSASGAGGERGRHHALYGGGYEKWRAQHTQRSARWGLGRSSSHGRHRRRGERRRQHGELAHRDGGEHLSGIGGGIRLRAPIRRAQGSFGAVWACGARFAFSRPRAECSRFAQEGRNTPRGGFMAVTTAPSARMFSTPTPRTRSVSRETRRFTYPKERCMSTSLPEREGTVRRRSVNRLWWLSTCGTGKSPSSVRGRSTGSRSMKRVRSMEASTMKLRGK